MLRLELRVARGIGNSDNPTSVPKPQRTKTSFLCLVFFTTSYYYYTSVEHSRGQNGTGFWRLGARLRRDLQKPVEQLKQHEQTVFDKQSAPVDLGSADRET